jgi:uncharacterized membrane protein
VRTITPYFQRRDFTGGVVTGIALIADELARHFPYDPDTDVNELPDTVDLGPRG